MAKETPKKESKKELVAIGQLADKIQEIPDKITNEETLYSAIDLMLKVRSKFNEIEERRKARTAPINESLRLINSDYKPFLEPLKELEQKIGDAVIDFQNRKIGEDMIKLDNIRKETGDKSLTIPVGFAALPGSLGEVRFRKAYEISIIDESKVPKQYRTIDTRAIQKEVDQMDGDIKIPGVAIKVVSNTAIYLNK